MNKLSQQKHIFHRQHSQKFKTCNYNAALIDAQCKHRLRKLKSDCPDKMLTVIINTYTQQINLVNIVYDHNISYIKTSMQGILSLFMPRVPLK